METEVDFKRDLAGAALILVLGVVVAAVGVGYRMGTMTNMGAGYVPVVLGVFLVIVGALMAITTYAARGKKLDAGSVLPNIGQLPAAPGEGFIQWRGWLCILGGVAAFVIAGGHLGLVPAIFLAVFVSALGDRANSLRDSLLLAAAMTVAGVAIFSWGLKLTFPLFTFS